MVLLNPMESKFVLRLYHIINGFFSLLLISQRNKLRFERILRTANRPEVLLKEMTVTFRSSSTFHIEFFILIRV